MASMSEITQLCRLCLIKDEVNVPIFQDVNVIDQIFLKISACLPIKVSKEDKLPKKICDACSYKLELFYDFLNTSKASEKQLRKWIDQLGAEKESSKGINPTTIILKQEIQDPAVDLSQDELSISTAAHNYSIQQQQLSYGETVEFELPQEGFININEASTVISSSRKRPAESEHGLSDDSEYDDDVGLVGSKITKMEDDEDSEIDADQTAFIDLPSGSGENDQAGPSGVGKETADAPYLPQFLPPIVSLEETNPPDALKQSDLKHFITETKTKRKQQKPSKLVKSEIKNDEFSEDDANFGCHICKNEQKYTEKELRLHFKTEHKGRRLRRLHEEDPVECDICTKQFKNTKSLKEHLARHNKQFNCDLCTSHFRTLLSYTIHLRLHSQDDEFKCILCDFKTDLINDITLHVNQFHSEDFKYICKQCGKGFHVLSWFEEHGNIHTGAKPFECDECGKQFPYSQYLVAHRNVAHKTESNDIPNVYECVICKKQYQHRNSLKLHMNVHTGNVEICDICGKSLSSREKLKFHMRTHTGYKPFSCSLCGKCFTKKPILIEHQRIHTGEKPYACEFCFKCFSQRSSMVIHMRGHTGERPYVCHICNKGFVARAMLNLHFRTCRGIM